MNKNETKRSKGYSRRNEGRRMSQGRNEEIRKGGIGIGRRRWKKRRKRGKGRRQPRNRVR